MASSYSFYRPLDRSRPSIRLLKLLPGKETDCINIVLEHYILNDVPSFEAVSYVWGQLTGEDGIFCDGHSFKARTRLINILRSLRRLRCARLLWIDAISINQSDFEERITQIKLMPQIYGAATRTLCWACDHGSLGGFMSLTRELQHYKDSIERCFASTDVFRSTHRITQQDLQSFDTIANQLDSDTQRDVEAFLNEDYFQRYVPAHCHEYS